MNVIIGCGNEVIARHQRSYAKAHMIFDPLHFLPLLEQKVGALDQAAPLLGRDLPDVFATLHRLLEARMGKPSKRGYDEVLRLVDTFDMDIVQRAIGQAIEACEKAGITPIRSARILSAPQLQRRRGSRG